ncbi:hypothetical protein GQ600_17502 [Phytophthora cactorum]|nr:hypothetical protein GQ600_17502 [Phytophthora cactorum]
MVDYLKELLSMDPRQRNKLVGGRRMEQNADELEMKPRLIKIKRALGRNHILPASTTTAAAGPRYLGSSNRSRYPSFLPPPPAFMKQPNQRQSPRERKKNRAETSRYSHVQEASAQTTRDRKANLRSGDFANKSLGEAIHGFKLRVSTPAPPQKSSRASLPSKIPQVQSVYICNGKMTSRCLRSSLRNSVLRFINILRPTVCSWFPERQPRGCCYAKDPQAILHPLDSILQLVTTDQTRPKEAMFYRTTRSFLAMETQNLDANRTSSLFEETTTSNTKNSFHGMGQFTRVSVIAKRNEMIRETRFLNTIFQAWVSSAALIKHERELLLQQRNRVIHNLQRACFREWKRATRYKRTVKKVQELRWQDSRRITKQIVFWNWKLFLYSVSRPLQERAAHLGYRIQCRQTRVHFREWRRLIEIDRMNKLRLRRRIWRRWVEWRHRVQSENVKVFFGAWRITASEQATSRRSLNLAKRYVNRRRLRKLWMHWKYFSMAKRKYTQDSTKALKHYFIKLLRTSWRAWKERTHAIYRELKPTSTEHSSAILTLFELESD